MERQDYSKSYSVEKNDQYETNHSQKGISRSREVSEQLYTEGFNSKVFISLDDTRRIIA